VANEPWMQLDFRRTEKVEFNGVRLRKAKGETLQHTEKHNLVTGIYKGIVAAETWLSYLPRKRRIVLVTDLVSIFTDNIVASSVDRT
jgi:hypothetical protein